MPDGCSGEPDREFLTFLRYVWNFDRDSRPGIEKTRPAVGPEVPTVQFQHRRQIEALLKDFPAAPPVFYAKPGSTDEPGGDSTDHTPTATDS